MGKSRSAFEVIALAGALVLCVGAMGWFAGWWGDKKQTTPPEDPTPTETVPGGSDPGAPVIALQQMRKEGSRYDCYAMGRITGDVLLSGKLKAYRLKVGQAREKAKWFAPWTMHFTSTIERNDGEVLEESRAFHEVRFMRSLAPPELTQLDYKLEPWVNKSLASLAAKLAMTPDTGAQVGSFAAMAALAGQKVDFANAAKLFGVDEAVLGPQADAIHAAASVADAFEGQSVLVKSEKGKIRWYHSPEAPQPVINALERASAPIDYGPLAAIELAIGEEQTVGNQVINDMFPPDLREQWFDGNDVVMELTLKRGADETGDDRKHAALAGTGKLEFKSAGASRFTADISHARALIDITDESGRFLHLLELTVPLEASLLTKRKFFYDVNFAGDLVMVMTYRVNLVPEAP